MIWFTSDTHYSHSNISCKEISTWSSGYRNFKSLQEMNDTLVECINKYVKEDDTLYHLGDWSFGGVKNILEFRNRIKCKNIHLTIGNHDQHIVDKRIVINDSEFNPIKLFSSVNQVLNIQHGKTKLFLSHYSHRVWDGSHKSIIHLYGHSHGSIEDWGKSMDVGVDVAYRMFGEWRPFSITEIIDIMSKRQVSVVDAHIVKDGRNS